MADDAEVARGALQIGLDLRLRGEAGRPVRVQRKGERVQVARYVAAAARIAVVAPDTADVVRALEDDEVVAAGLLQLNSGAEAGEAAADDDDVAFFHVSSRLPYLPWVTYSG